MNFYCRSSAGSPAPRGGRAFVGAIAAAAYCGTALAGSVSWVTPGVGDFDDGANWQGGSPPGATQTAAFDIQNLGNILVRLRSDAQVDDILVDGFNNVTFSLDANTLTLNDPGESVFVLDGQLTFETGDPALVDAAGDVRASGGELAIRSHVNLTSETLSAFGQNALLQVVGDGAVADVAIFSAGGGASACIGSEAVVETSGPASFLGAAPFPTNGEISGQLLVGEELVVMGTFGGEVELRINAGGAVSSEIVDVNGFPNGAASVVVAGTGATWDSARPLFVRGHSAIGVFEGASILAESVFLNTTTDSTDFGLFGNGTVEGLVSMSTGAISPNADLSERGDTGPQTLALDGGLNASGENTTLVIDIFASGADSIVSAGGIGLPQALSVNPLTFTPTNGQTFTIVEAAAVQSEFAVLDLPTLPGGLLWGVDYTDTTVTLRTAFGRDCNGNGILDESESFAADFNSDGRINSADLSILLGSWGPCPAPCPEDLDGDGFIDSDDLAMVLGSWLNCD